MTYERIAADDVRVGDVVAHTRTARFTRVTDLYEGNVSRLFALEFIKGEEPDWLCPTRAHGMNAGTIRPRRTTKLWRRTP